MPNTNTNTTKTPAKKLSAAAAAKKLKNKHTFLGMCRPDRAPKVSENADGTLTVDLFGRHASADRSRMVLDAADWPKIRGTWGDTWVIVPHGGSFYIGSGRRQAARWADQPNSKPPVAVLARLLMGAAKGEAVVYLDGRFSNLRRSNLQLLSASDAARRRALIIQAKYQAVARSRFPEIFAALDAAAE